ncbi:MAG: ATP-dependent Clp protease proteolytic subunit [Candidatus Niyogibacteria bacterium]|nr:ATP-dependent Clp protease proteolytic subunit [Candidatus Niyogibacteria bacterium]
MIPFRDDRAFCWIGDVNEENTARAIEQFKSFETPRGKKKVPAQLILSSSGGDMGSGFAFYDYIRFVSRIELITIGLGEIKSMGIVIFLAGNRRLITPNTLFYFHEGNFIGETRSDLSRREAEADLMLIKLEDARYEVIVSKATEGRHSLEDVRRWSRECYIFTADEAVRVGLAHEIIT